MPLKPGLYDLVLTHGLERLIEDSTKAKLGVALEQLSEAEAAGYLSKLIGEEFRQELRGLESSQQTSRVNPLLKDPVVEPAQVLRAVYDGPREPLRPTTPLSQSGLIMNSIDEPRLGFELEREMKSCDEVWMLVSFIQWRGWQRMRIAMEDLARAGRRIRVLTTTYIGASDYKALEAMASLPNVELRISLDGRRRRLHAKAWLFVRDNGFSSAYVGSANLSGPALEDGIEWTMKLSEAEAPHVVEKFRGAFESYWNDPEFELYSPQDEAMCARVREALEAGRGTGKRKSYFFDLKPHPYQQMTLDQLEAERLDRGRWRNLVVAPTGTGKTLVAAFDYARQSSLRPRLLFMAHREELLKQAREAFRHVLRDESFGQLLAGGEEPASYEFLFATVQSLASRNLIERLGGDYWNYVVLDEAHHTPAASYRDLLDHLKPKILLGLTATPERMDGESILPWFDGCLADDMRLWQAIERQYLVPFDYYGVFDGTDLSELSWRRGGYAIAELNQMLSGNERRAQLVVRQFCEIYGEVSEARAIGFCVSVQHAEFMAEMFRQAGIAAEAITSASNDEARRRAPQRLKDREVNVLFTVDLYNEGVDIPSVDAILFLRPTESVTVFLQQLGRGLRLEKGKRSCLVLDFIGNQRREFRFDLRYRALFGGTRQEVIRQIETGVTRLPGSCYFRLDQESQSEILSNLKRSLETRRSRIVEEVRTLGASLGRRPKLGEFLSETQYELGDIYKDTVAGWTGLLRDAGWLEGELGEHDLLLSRQFKFLLHLDSRRLMGIYETLQESGNERASLMLTHRWLQGRAKDLAVGPNRGMQLLRESGLVRREFLELLGLLQDQVRVHRKEEFYRQDWPLCLHRSYMRDEILTAVGYKTWGGKAQNREGVLWMEEEQTELLFVTLEKDEKQFSPSTRYEDYAVSPRLFHWQSQSRTTETSKTGQRYIKQRQNGVKILLFVKPKVDAPFVFLGEARYVSHHGSKPMSITWELIETMPAWIFELSASFRAA
jgi:superfamily II DNA or RNA helicase/HKD family nuclease